MSGKITRLGIKVAEALIARVRATLRRGLMFAMSRSEETSSWLAAAVSRTKVMRTTADFALSDSIARRYSLSLCRLGFETAFPQPESFSMSSLKVSSESLMPFGVRNLLFRMPYRPAVERSTLGIVSPKSENLSMRLLMLVSTMPLSIA